jgi:hypothetical protein
MDELVISADRFDNAISLPESPGSGADSDGHSMQPDE